MDRVCVNVKNGALGGGAYNGVPEISNAPRAADYLVTLRLGNGRERWPLGPVNYHFKRPDETGPRNRFPFFVCEDWEEWLVKLAAHEAKHIEQFRDGLSAARSLRALRGREARGVPRAPRRLAHRGRSASFRSWTERADRERQRPGASSRPSRCALSRSSS